MQRLVGDGDYDLASAKSFFRKREISYLETATAAYCPANDEPAPTIDTMHQGQFEVWQGLNKLVLCRTERRQRAQLGISIDAQIMDGSTVRSYHREHVFQHTISARFYERLLKHCRTNRTALDDLIREIDPTTPEVKAAGRFPERVGAGR